MFRWEHGLCCVFCSPGALTFGYGCTVHVGVDVGAGDAEADVIYITFIMSVQYIEYLVPYKDKVQGQVDNLDNSSTVYSTFFTYFLISLIADGPHHYHPACDH